MDRVYDEKQAAPFLGVSRSLLRQSRSKNPRVEGPPWLKIGHAVRYRESDLKAWQERHLVDPAGGEVGGD